jgi:hypothetical protein
MEWGLLSYRDSSPEMKTLPELLQQAQVAVPDSYFWYTLSLLLAVALIGIIWRFAERVSKTLDELKIIVKVHESEIESLKETVRSTFMVKYTKGK